MLELLAENNFGDTRSGSLAGPTGLVIILLLAIGTVLLIRNMNARLKRLPERFEDEPRSEQLAPRPGAKSAATGEVDLNGVDQPEDAEKHDAT
jgi:hypothetical protein